MPGISVGRLASKRWREYRDIRLEAPRTEPYAFGSSYGEERGQTGAEWRRRMGNVLFAFRDGKPVGTLTLVFDAHRKRSHVADIYGVYVRSGSRGLGAGDKLIERAIELGRGRGILKMDLDVNPRQGAALRLYEKHGFRVVGRQRKELRINGRYSDMLIMERFA